MQVLGSTAALMGASALFLGGCTSLGGTAQADSPSETRSVSNHCQMVDATQVISSENLSKLIHIAEGNSPEAMHKLLGLPYCFVGSTEYYPVDRDRTTWIGITYDDDGNYEGFKISANNTPEGVY